MVFVSHSGYKDNDNIPHIHVSADNGSTWTNISGDLPPFAINAIELSNLNDSLIFVATDGGVYFTLNQGVNWERLGTNMPLFQIYDVELEVATGKLIAGTYARSIWSIGVDSILSWYNLALVVSGSDTICSGSQTQLHASGAASYAWSNAASLSCANCPDPVASPLVTTQYVVTATSGASSAVDSITVVVNPAPTASVSQTGDTLFATGGSSYQWYENSLPIANATSSFYVVQNDGNYNVVSLGPDGCSQSSTTIAVTNVGLNEVALNTGLKLYPNPVSEDLIIEKLLPGEWQLVIRDMEGRTIKQGTLAADKTEIDLGSLAGGIYLAQITNGKASVTRKISKL